MRTPRLPRRFAPTLICAAATALAGSARADEPAAPSREATASVAPSRPGPTIPRLVLAPGFGSSLLPFHPFGVGVGVHVHWPRLVHVAGRLSYGLPAPRSTSPIFAELYVGYPLTWTEGGKDADLQAQSTASTGPGAATSALHQPEKPTTPQMLSFEVGLVSAGTTLRVWRDPRTYVDEAHRLTYAVAGVRRAWVQDDPRGRRYLNSWWIHLVAPPIGVPDDGPGSDVRLIYPNSAVARRPLGVKLGFSLWGLDGEVAYLPGPESFSYSLRTTWPTWL